VAQRLLSLLRPSGCKTGQSILSFFTLCSEAEVVEQIWVYGNSYESFLVAIVVPNARAIKAWASSADIGSSDIKDICKSVEVG
jgi:hypothetical protein